jgi:hypothetical protein
MFDDRPDLIIFPGILHRIVAFPPGGLQELGGVRLERADRPGGVINSRGEVAQLLPDT